MTASTTRSCSNIGSRSLSSRSGRNKPRMARATVRTEKRKRGKLVTLVQELNSTDCDLDELLTTLKNHCGAGGTVKDDVLEIQGDQAKRVREKLLSLGFNVK